jgi:hypothetical protein
MSTKTWSRACAIAILSLGLSPNIAAAQGHGHGPPYGSPQEDYPAGQKTVGIKTLKAPRCLRSGVIDDVP